MNFSKLAQDIGADTLIKVNEYYIAQRLIPYICTLNQSSSPKNELAQSSQYS